MENKFTGFYDDAKQKIFIGDTLQSEWGYKVIVTDELDGKLVCDDKHPCKNIPYDLNKGKGYKKVT